MPVFVTIDPARDTPKVVKEFTAAFYPRMVGLTGTPAQVDAAAKADRSESTRRLLQWKANAKKLGLF